MAERSSDIPLELAMKIGSCNVQAAAKIAQLSKACNTLLRDQLNECKQRWKFEKMVAMLFNLVQPRYGRRTLDDNEYREAISFLELVSRWRSIGRSSTLIFESLLQSLNVASVVSAFAETDDLQTPLLHLFSEYRCLLIKHKFTNRHHFSVGSPELFIEYYEGRRISSMRRPMFERHFEVEICAAVSFDRRCALFPFAWLDYTKAQFDDFIFTFSSRISWSLLRKRRWIVSTI